MPGDITLTLASAVAVFVISLLANSIPFVGFPYLALIPVLIVAGADPAVLVLSSALGAAVGKLVIYFVSQKTLSKLPKETVENLRAFREVTGKYLWLLIFIAAATPMPDDAVYVIVGASRYPLGKYFTAVLAGKVIVTAAAATFGMALESTLETLDYWHRIAATTIASLYATAVLMLTDWKTIAQAYKQYSPRKATLTLIKELAKASAKPAAILAIFVYTYLKHRTTQQA